MKLLISHCKEYKTVPTAPATRPRNVQPESLSEGMTKQDCLAVLVTVEPKDGTDHLDRAVSDIHQTLTDTGRDAVCILPFAHLSNKLAGSEQALQILDALEDKIDAAVERDHFGSHKELLLHVHGHAGNMRYREY